MRYRITLGAVLALLVFGWVSAPAVAQTSASATGADTRSEVAPEDMFFEVVDVNLVNVLVWVTDKKGEPVIGLKKDDFEILEDGKPVEVTNFFAVERGRPTPDSDGVEKTEPVPGRPPLPLITSLPEDQRLYLIVYVDNFNLAPANRNRVLNRLQGFLYSQLGPEDQIMLVSYDRSLHVRQPFTTDASLVTAALEEVKDLSGHQVDRIASRRRALEEIEEVDWGGAALSAARSHADEVYAEMDFTLKAMGDLMQALSGLQGRKALLYVSDGLPMSVAEDLFIAVDERFPRASARGEAFAYDLQPEFRRLAAQANTSGVTFYTLDAGGAEIHSSLSAEEGGTRQGGGRIYVDSIYNANLQEPLHLMADTTGGIAFTNTNAIEASLDRVSSDFGNFYSLGFRPGHAGSGRYYKLEVKAGKGLRVRHREGYRDQTPEARMADGSLSSLYFGFQRNSMNARIVFDSPSPRDGNSYLVPVQVKIPLNHLTLVPQGDRHNGQFRITVTVMDDEGRLSPVQQKEPVVVAIPAADLEQAMGQHFSYDLQLVMRKGVNRLAVGVRDEIGGETSFVHDTIRVGG
ncbi:MAG: VWA domain-containing protein [bacterium]|nr:VWA domain-containing protein [bacterium]